MIALFTLAVMECVQNRTIGSVQTEKGETKMLCELCKRNNANPRMGAILKDVNGNTEIKLCQPCLKKLKTAVKSSKPMVIDIYPVKMETGKVN